MLLGIGSHERLLDDARGVAARAHEAGVNVELNIYEGMVHGFLDLPVTAAEAMMERIATFCGAAVHRGREPEATDPPLTIRRVGWAGYEITSEQGTRVLVDPYLSDVEATGVGLPDSPFSVADLTDVDVVAVTHAGYDYRGSALEIVAAGDATLVSGSVLAAEAHTRKIAPERAITMVSGVTYAYRDVTIKALDARHQSSMHNSGGFVCDQPMSFLVTTSAGSRVFCGGDSSLSGDMHTWGELHHPQIAVLGVSGLLVADDAVIEMGPSEAAQAARWLGADVVLPVDHGPGDPAPAQLAANLGHDESITVVSLKFGETWTAAPSLVGG